jgi:hypothetical protein
MQGNNNGIRSEADRNKDLSPKRRKLMKTMNQRGGRRKRNQELGSGIICREFLKKVSRGNIIREMRLKERRNHEERNEMT